MRKIVFVAAIVFAASLGSSPALADVVARIDIFSQRMTVMVDGVVRHVWPVSTARRGYVTPTGSFKPVRMERVWYSTIYHGSPMPYAIFFHHGFAVHGTYETHALGRPASHGCVRLPTSAARELYYLVRKYGLVNSRIVVSG